MEMLKASRANGQRVLAMYRRNIGYNLYDVYGNYSRAKANAFDECFKWYSECNQSRNFHICSRNSHQFTVGWEYIDSVTGHRIVRVETSNHTYIVDTEV